jgi:hypothetical protein
MASAEVRSFDSPDETRPTANRGRPIAGTESCQAPHVGYAVSGRMAFRMDDGTEGEIKAGDAFVLPPGQYAWVIGDEEAVQVDFNGMEAYAKPS